MAKMTLKIKVSDPHFQYHPRVSRMHVLCKFGDSDPNLWRVITWKSKFPRIVDKNGQNDLKGQGQWAPFSIAAMSIPWCMFDANLVILAQICDELSCVQNKVYRWTVRWTDRRRQRQYPFGLKGVKMVVYSETRQYCWHNSHSMYIAPISSSICTCIWQKISKMKFWILSFAITLTPYMVLPLFATRFADYVGGTQVSFIQPRVF